MACTGCTQFWGGTERVVIPHEVAVFCTRAWKWGTSPWQSSLATLPSLLSQLRDPLPYFGDAHCPGLIRETPKPCPLNLPPDRPCHPPCQLSSVSQERLTDNQPLWPRILLGEINPQKKRSPQLLFLLCERCPDQWPAHLFLHTRPSSFSVKFRDWWAGARACLCFSASNKCLSPNRSSK